MSERMDLTRKKKKRSSEKKEGSQLGKRAIERDDSSLGNSSSEEEEENSSDGRDAALAALRAHFSQSFDTSLPSPDNQAGNRPNSVKESRRSAGKGKAPERTNGEKDGMRREGDLKGARTADLSAEQSIMFKLDKPKQEFKKDLRSMDQAEKADSETKRRAKPETVVFGETTLPSKDLGDSRGGWRSFMSSKVDLPNKEKNESLVDKKQGKRKQKTGEGSDASDDEGGGETEKQNQSNDKALSELLSTTLFAPGGAVGSGNGEKVKGRLSSNDVLGRLMELSSSSSSRNGTATGRGWGEAAQKASEMSKMPAGMRAGLRRAEKERQQKEVETAKELGNYHKSVKGLIGKKAGADLIMGTRDKDRKSRTREKGLGMGVGKFAGGVLKLSDGDVDKVNKEKKGGFHSNKSKRRKK